MAVRGRKRGKFFVIFCISHLNCLSLFLWPSFLLLCSVFVTTFIRELISEMYFRSILIVPIIEIASILLLLSLSPSRSVCHSVFNCLIRLILLLLFFLAFKVFSFEKSKDNRGKNWFKT